MGLYIRGIEMQEDTILIAIGHDGTVEVHQNDDLTWQSLKHKAVPVPPHVSLKRRIVYRGEVYNALEAARINSLDGILTDPYKEGLCDGLKRAIQILANEVEDAPTIIPADQFGDVTEMVKKEDGT